MTRGMSAARIEAVGRNRAAALASARRLFAHRAFEDVGFQEIAFEAGLTKSGVAFIFGTKAALYEEAVGRPPIMSEPSSELVAIPDFPCYGATAEGEIWRTAPLPRGSSHSHRPLPYRLKPTSMVRGGYPVVAIADSTGRRAHRPVHRLIALAFLGPPPSAGHEVAHNDGDTANAAASNLRWATHADNMADMKLHGTYSPPPRLAGESNPNCSLSEADVAQIRAHYRFRQNARELAEEFGVVPATITSIANGSRRSCDL